MTDPLFAVEDIGSEVVVVLDSCLLTCFVVCNKILYVWCGL